MTTSRLLLTIACVLVACNDTDTKGGSSTDETSESRPDFAALSADCFADCEAYWDQYCDCQLSDGTGYASKDECLQVQEVTDDCGACSVESIESAYEGYADRGGDCGTQQAEEAPNYEACRFDAAQELSCADLIDYATVSNTCYDETRVDDACL